MQWLDRLERRFGNWSIPHLALLIVTANGFIYLLALTRPEFLTRLMLIPEAVQQGEWWRLVTFLFVPPLMGPLWMVFWLLLLYTYADALEQEWGEFRFCFFYLIGALATIIAALAIAHQTLSNVWLNTTLFLAFATRFPNFELLLFFILPVKVKYLGYITWLVLAWAVIVGSFGTRVAIAASLLNYILFFGPEIWERGKLKLAVLRNRRRFRGE